MARVEVWMIALFLAAALAADRVEISVGDARDVDVVPAGKHGVVLFVQRKGDKKAYEINGYDTSFAPTWSVRHELDKQQAETAKGYDADNAWVLLQRGYKTSVLKASLTDGSTSTLDVQTALKGWTSELRTDETGGAWISGSRGKHGLLSYVGPDGASNAVDLGKKRLVSGLTLGNDGHVQAAIRDWKQKPGTPFTVLDLKDGAVTRTHTITPDGDLTLISGRALELEGDDMMAGTWQPRGLIQGAQGMYLAGYNDQGQTFFNKFAFSELENGLEFLKDSREERVEKRISKREAKGKETKIRWNLLIHDPLQTAEGFTLVAEAFYPVYRTETRTVTVSDGKGGTTTQVQTVQVFVGWSFSHCLVIGFDLQGERLWDHSLPLQSAPSPVLREHVRLLVKDGTTEVIYAHRSRLTRAVIQGNELLVEEDQITTADAGAGDDVKKNLAGDAAWWYDDVFLLFGVDKVKEEGEKKDRVFFFSKLEREAGAPAGGQDALGGNKPLGSPK